MRRILFWNSCFLSWSEERCYAHILVNYVRALVVQKPSNCPTFPISCVGGGRGERPEEWNIYVLIFFILKFYCFLAWFLSFGGPCSIPAMERSSRPSSNTTEYVLVLKGKMETILLCRLRADPSWCNLTNRQSPSPAKELPYLLKNCAILHLKTVFMLEPLEHFISMLGKTGFMSKVLEVKKKKDDSWI